jgi:hypothetical protein
VNPTDWSVVDTDDEPWRLRQRLDDYAEGWQVGHDNASRRPVIYTIAVLAGLTLAAIAWRFLR